MFVIFSVFVQENFYRGRKDYAKEVAILGTYANHKHGPGVMPAKLMERLVKARQLLELESNRSGR